MDTADAGTERTILCYGDSNTWGYVPATETLERFDRGTRWPGVLERELGPSVRVIEEGMNGRTTVLDDPLQPSRNGRDYLTPCLQSHQPLDLVVIYLGTNDLADRYPLTPFDIARAAASLATLARTSGTGPSQGPPEVLLLGLPRLGPMELHADTMAGAARKAADLARHFERAAREAGVPLLELSEHAAYSDLDGIHLDAEGHRLVGEAVAAAVRDLWR